MIDARMLMVGGEQGASRGWLEHLRDFGANISVVTDGSDALRHLDLVEPEIVLLDLRLEGSIDGFDTCRIIRTRSAALVVAVADKVGTYDEVVALAVGADHFLHAETPVELVVARLRSLLRRSRGTVMVGGMLVESAAAAPRAVGSTASARGRSVPIRRPGQVSAVVGAGNGGNGSTRANGDHQNGRAGGGAASQLALLNGSGPDGPTERIVDGDLEIDLVARELRAAGTEVPLTRIEFDLLVTLARNPRRVFTREQLMASAWDHPFDGSHVLDAHLSRMRVKITEAGGERVAHAVRGVGYRLRS
jgi:two-component system, OmpR family, response regulator